MTAILPATRVRVGDGDGVLGQELTGDAPCAVEVKLPALETAGSPSCRIA